MRGGSTLTTTRGPKADSKAQVIRTRHREGLLFIHLYREFERLPNIGCMSRALSREDECFKAGSSMTRKKGERVHTICFRPPA